MTDDIRNDTPSPALGWIALGIAIFAASFITAAIVVAAGMGVLPWQ